MKSKKQTYWKLFFSTLKLSACTFGGGFVIIPLMRKKFVEELHWMQNSQNYTLADHTGDIVLKILHRGIIGGWNIEADDNFSPEIICGIFMFCRYIEQENEFITV